jgi:transcriptional regulator GlxA family with amidase domain
MADVAILVFDDCQASAVSVVTEALSVANLHWGMATSEDEPPFKWRTVSWDGRPVRTMAGLELVPDASIEGLGSPDLIFVPAIRSDDSEAMSRSIQKLNEIWGRSLQDHHRSRRYVAANCSAVFLLAEAGLLDGHTATTSWWLSSRFRRSYPKVRLTPEMLVAKDARVFSAAAFSACLNLGVEFIAEFLGPRAALSCARVMLIDVNRATQLPYANVHELTQHGDDLVARAQSLLLSNLRQPAQLDKLAGCLRVTSRTLNRRFKAATGETPLEFLQKARIERAKRLLEATTASVDEIVHRVGYDDTSSFRRLFKRVTGVSPFEYRERFATPDGPTRVEQ